SPNYLRLLVTPASQRHNHMVIGLGKSGPMARRFPAFSIGVQNLLVDGRGLRFHPGKQSGTEIETYLRIGAQYFGNPTFTVEDSRSRVRGITLSCDPFVPVVVGMG